MPKLDGIEVTRQIKALSPQTKVLILSAYDESQFVLRLLEGGADGYLLKSIRGNELVAAVRSIYNGGAVFHPSIARQVVNHFLPASNGVRGRDTSGTLSKRELDIVKLMARGLSNREIAAGLGLSIRTVQGHIGQVFKKLGVSSRTEAMVRVLKEGWVTLDDVKMDVTRVR